jgi:tetratricopeptide (TPR) repeat protein
MPGLWLVLLLILPSPRDWAKDYSRGLEFVRKGDGASAQAALENALRSRPDEALEVETEFGPVDYLPHLYLAIALHLQGRADAARAELALARSTGLSERSAVGRPLLEAYGLLLGPLEKTGFRSYSKSQGTLPEAEARKIESEVLSRCQVRASPLQAPWYYHYELGLELARKGDSSRALDAFLEAQARRPDPERGARLYGMWFEDYLPYFHIAKAHSALGNWECALSALRASSERREVAPKDPEFEELSRLVRDVEAHTTHEP